MVARAVAQVDAISFHRRRNSNGNCFADESLTQKLNPSQQICFRTSSSERTLGQKHRNSYIHFLRTCKPRYSNTPHSTKFRHKKRFHAPTQTSSAILLRSYYVVSHTGHLNTCKPLSLHILLYFIKQHIHNGAYMYRPPRSCRPLSRIDEIGR